MNAYERALKEFRAEYFVRAVIDAGGNALEASRRTGVHRNTISRVLTAAGYTPKDLRDMVKRHRDIHGASIFRKPVQSVDVDSIIRRAAR